MRDRVPTMVLPNGAIRFGEYDASGNLLGYKYIRREDEPTEAGTPNNKANLMPDTLATTLGLDPATATVADGFFAIPDFVHKRTVIYDQANASGLFVVDVSSVDFSDARMIGVEIVNFRSTSTSSPTAFMQCQDASSAILMYPPTAMAPTAATPSSVCIVAEFKQRIWIAHSFFNQNYTLDTTKVIKTGEIFDKSLIKQIKISIASLDAANPGRTVLWYA